MTDVSITPEDRERLAKSKFGEWFNEFFEQKFEESFQKKVEERQGQQPHPQQSQQPQQQADNIQQMPTRKRSLLEECLSQTFGF